MEATVQRTGKRAAKIFGAVCLATGVAALSAVVASGAAVGAVAEGFRSAKNVMREMLKKDGSRENAEAPEKSSAEM